MADFYQNNTLNNIDLFNNQYILIKHKNEIIDKYRWFNNEFIKVIKKKFKYTNILPPLDDAQLCSYDALFNQDLKVVCLTGKAGTGKTKTALSVATELLKQQVYDKILILRNPELQGKSMGFLQGDFNKKFIDGGFAGSIIDNLDGNKYEFDELIKKEIIELNIVSAIKGRNFKNTFIIVDEAQDLLPSNVLGIGTRINDRINDDSCKIVFCADYRQCASSKYLNNSGIKQLINKARGQDWFVNIELITNGRGQIAQWFGDNYID